MSFGIPGTSYRVCLSMMETFHFYYYSVLLMVTKVIKDQTSFPDAYQKVFDISMGEQIDLILKEAVIPIPFD